MAASVRTRIWFSITVGAWKIERVDSNKIDVTLINPKTKNEVFPSGHLDFFRHAYSMLIVRNADRDLFGFRITVPYIYLLKHRRLRNSLHITYLYETYIHFLSSLHHIMQLNSNNTV